MSVSRVTINLLWKKFIYDFFSLFLLGTFATVGFMAAVAIAASAAAYFIVSSPLTATQINQPITIDVASHSYHKFIGLTQKDKNETITWDNRLGRRHKWSQTIYLIVYPKRHSSCFTILLQQPSSTILTNLYYHLC